MKRLLLLIVLAAPLTAQTTATLYVTSQQNTGSGTFPFEGQDLDIEFDDATGFGVGVSREFGSWSGELAVFRTSSNGAIQQNGTNVFDLGDLELTPITAMIRRHFGPVYLGGGVAYVMTSDLETETTTVSLENETTFVAGAGVAWDFSERWGVVADVRYMPLTIGARPEPDEDRIDADIDPILVSAGLRLRF